MDIRQRKFRAIKDDMSNPNWVYGSGLTFSHNGQPKIYIQPNMFHTCLVGTEGQTTGKMDSAEIEIFECDIVKFLAQTAPKEPLKEFVGQIAWSNKKSGYVIVYRVYKDDVIFDQKHAEIGECTIIADTFHNPELKIL